MACSICMLGCGGEAEDSLEHYAYCKVVHAAARKFLRIHVDIKDAKDWFFLNGSNEEDEDCLRGLALLHYTTYNATNHYRHNGVPETKRAEEALEQYLKNAVEGHAESTSYLDNRWLEEYIPNTLPKRRRTG